MTKPTAFILKLATELKSTSLPVEVICESHCDLQLYAHDTLSGEAFTRLCHEVVAALPLVRFDRNIAASQARAGMDYRREVKAERQALGWAA